MKWTTLCAVVGVMCMARAAQAGVMEDAVAVASKGDFTTAIGMIRPLAEQGDAEAGTALGVFYYYGRGVPRDLGQAATLIQKAADQGNTDAAAFLPTVKQSQQDEQRCLMYGAARGTPGFETCFTDLSTIRTNMASLQMQVQQQQQAAQNATRQAQTAAQQAQAAAAQAQSASMLSILMGGGGANPARGGVGAVGPRFFVGEQVSGFNKICYYNRNGSREAETIASTQFCPQM